MLNLKFIQDNPELVIEKLKRKNFDAKEIVNIIPNCISKKINCRDKPIRQKPK